MIRKKGVRVEAQSIVKIRDWTLAIRKAFSLQDSLYFPVVEFLEDVIPGVFHGDYEYPKKEEMGSVEGLTIPETNMIRIREDVYEAAMRGEGRARFTIAHEIGHFIMHKNYIPSFARVTNKSIPDHKIYEDSEWQADTWASELLMPYHLVKGKSADEIKEKCKVSGCAAEIRLSKIQ